MDNLPLVTAVPATVDALVSAFAAIPSDAAFGDLIVYDGPDLDARNQHNIIALGVGDPSISGTATPQDRGFATDEGFDVEFLTWAWNGDGSSMKACRDRCVAVITAMRAIVDAQPVDGVWLRMGTDFSWTQAVSGEGRSCSYQSSIRGVASI